jgi:hypothetical protein
MTTIVAPSNDSKWQMGFNSTFKGSRCPRVWRWGLRGNMKIANHYIAWTAMFADEVLMQAWPLTSGAQIRDQEWNTTFAIPMACQKKYGISNFTVSSLLNSAPDNKPTTLLPHRCQFCCCGHKMYSRNQPQNISLITNTTPACSVEVCCILALLQEWPGSGGWKWNSRVSKHMMAEVRNWVFFTCRRQWRVWGLRHFGMLRCVTERLVPDVSNHRAGPISKDRMPSE